MVKFVIFMFIQILIFTDKPYFNETGYENIYDF